MKQKDAYEEALSDYLKMIEEIKLMEYDMLQMEKRLNSRRDVMRSQMDCLQTIAESAGFHIQ